MLLGIETEEGGMRRPWAYNGQGHMLTIGPTRSGKSRRLLIPNLLYQTGQSFLVIDIKGELAAITSGHRASKGGHVVALDPFSLLATRGVDISIVGFNPLDALDPGSDDFVDDAMVIAEALVQVSPTAKDPHWAESAQDLVAALIMLVRCAGGEEANLTTVRRMVCGSASDMEKLANEVASIQTHPAISNKLAKFANSRGNDEINSVLSTAQTQTRFLDSPAIARSLQAASFDFELLKSRTTTVYLVLPPERLVTHAKWLRLVVSSAMRAMQRVLRVGNRPDVVFMLDEFPQLGRLQSIETAVSLNAGFGVKVWIAVQHLGQLKDHYDNNWETFISASCVTAFAPRDVFTRDHLTRMIGTGWKMMRSVSQSSQGGTNITDSMQKDDLVTPHEWRAMALGELWAFIPTSKEQLIKRLKCVDFTELPEVMSGAFRVGAA